jgi:hypothetical protein
MTREIAEAYEDYCIQLKNGKEVRVVLPPEMRPIEMSKCYKYAPYLFVREIPVQ